LLNKEKGCPHNKANNNPVKSATGGVTQLPYEDIDGNAPMTRKNDSSNNIAT
jgi:hypothetical protein